ncbi:hypothetical protein JCM21900_005212 [Sporobolomyces salmonicolor]
MFARCGLDKSSEVQQAARSLFGTYLAALPNHRIVDLVARGQDKLPARQPGSGLLPGSAREACGVGRGTKDQNGKAVGQREMYGLAAASQRCLPSVSEHTIQSGKGSRVVETDQAPKALATVVDEWSNDGFILSFELEIDRSLIVPKAPTALERYRSPDCDRKLVTSLLHI